MQALERQDCQASILIASCIVAIMTCELLYQVYLILNCMGHAVILAL